MNVKKQKKQKRITEIIKIDVVAGSATPAPPIGSVLGQRKLNIMKFCKEFNAYKHPEGVVKGDSVPVRIFVYADRSFSFRVCVPTVSFLIKKFLGVSKGAASPGRDNLSCKLTQDIACKIAKMKMPDLNARCERGAIATVYATAASMGIVAD